jgi:hypothetical protein
MLQSLSHVFTRLSLVQFSLESESLGRTRLQYISIDIDDPSRSFWKGQGQSENGTWLCYFCFQAFGFLQDPEGGTGYLWKAVTIAGGVYLFFLIERILKIILDVRKVSRLGGRLLYVYIWYTLAI